LSQPVFILAKTGMESNLIYHLGYIKAHFAINKKRIFYNTGVKTSNLLLDTRCFVKRNSHPNWSLLNEQILKSKQKLDVAILLDMQAHGQVDIGRVKKYLYKGPSQSEVGKSDKSLEDLSDLLSEFISQGVALTAHDRKCYDQLLQILLEEKCIISNIKASYLQTVLRIFQRNLNSNTANNRYKLFKRFIIWCQNTSQLPLPKFDWRKFKRITFKPDFVFLTDERIEELQNYAPTSNINLDTKEIFLILIYTGLRFSDYVNLSRADVQHSCIDKISRKTKIRFKVPIHEAILPALQRLPKMSSQTFNRHVKIIGLELGWSEIVKFRKDTQEFIYIPFYEMLCSSVGRHTFATRALLAGVPHNIILGWCGWASSTLLFYYSEIIKLETATWMEKIR
jgi:integrase